MSALSRSVMVNAIQSLSPVLVASAGHEGGGGQGCRRASTVGGVGSVWCGSGLHAVAFPLSGFFNSLLFDPFCLAALNTDIPFVGLLPVPMYPDSVPRVWNIWRHGRLTVEGVCRRHHRRLLVLDFVHSHGNEAIVMACIGAGVNATIATRHDACFVHKVFARP
eukprot:360178-Chlamydomonas_euryale.AAC.9